ncbi:MAG TPA: hypothetical protein PLX79_01925 [Candidatus Dojkabacteria bacterium]|jgi:hypothetical protein|nr:hypothetical protein [Candidatus Dojkabacteria bacterium]
MVLPLVQDMLHMSAESLRTRYPQDYKYIKAIAQEKWPHIQIEEKSFKEDVKGFRNLIGDTSAYWLIVINTDLSDKEKYLALIHELLHCTLDEVKLLSREEEEKLVTTIEKRVGESF